MMMMMNKRLHYNNFETATILLSDAKIDVNLKTKVHSCSSGFTNVNNYDFFGELLRIVRIFLKTADSLSERYPNHDTLRQIAKSADAILGQEIDAPLINFLDGLETMMSLIREWQHKDRDFGEILHAMVNLANKLLKMRLESWKLIFETRRESMEEEIGKDFYMFFCELLTLTIDQVPEFFNKVVNFIELSPIGLVENNLRMIEAFGIYSLRFEVGEIFYSVLMNVVYKYRRFVPQIDKYIKSELTELEKKMKEYVDLQKCDFDSDKKHFIRIDKVKVQLNKYCQQHLSVLQLQFKQLKEQFAMKIANESDVPFINDTNNEELNDKIKEIFEREEPLRSRVYEARRYINTEMGITSSNNEKRSQFAESSFFLFANKPLYGKEFQKHNTLYGEALVLLEEIKTLSRSPHEELSEESEEIFGIAENLIIRANEELSELFVKPFIERDDIKFLVKQVVGILESFVDLDTTDDKGKIENIVDKVNSYVKLEFFGIVNYLKDNYAHYSFAQIIDKSIKMIRMINNVSLPIRNKSVFENKDEMKWAFVIHEIHCCHIQSVHCCIERRLW